jgi:hypothetical protein
MRFVMINARGLGKEKWKEVSKLLPEETKVVAIQETHCDKLRGEMLEKVMGKSWWVEWGWGEKDSRRVALAFDRKWFSEVEVRLRSDRRLCCVTKDRKGVVENSGQFMGQWRRVRR